MGKQIETDLIKSKTPEHAARCKTGRQELYGESQAIGMNCRLIPKARRRADWAKAVQQSPYGEIMSAWEIKDGVFKMKIRVPFGSEALVVLPNGDKHTVAGGEYEF